MKIAIVTWTSNKNYGTVLQAYALQSFLHKSGYNNAIISDTQIVKKYSNSYLSDVSKKHTFSKKRLLSPKYIVSHCLDFLFLKYKSSVENNYHKSRENIDKFKQKLNFDTNSQNEDFTNINKKYNMVICGSDQIWSVFDDSFNSYYYLNNINIKKIAYAPSIGTTKIPVEKQELIKQYLSSFFAISVRESETATQLSTLTGKKVSCVCDPTLLISKMEWEFFSKSSKVNKHNYLLCYFLENKEWYFEYAQKIAKEKQMQILLIPSKSEFILKKATYKKPITVEDFVNFFNKSSFVLTDSYHGLIFSLIFEKQVSYLKRFSDSDEKNENIRIYSLSQKIELPDIIISEDNPLKYSEKIDYSVITPNIKRFSEESMNFLLKNIGE